VARKRVENPPPTIPGPDNCHLHSVVGSDYGPCCRQCPGRSFEERASVLHASPPGADGLAPPLRSRSVTVYT
jgi:hypothetical protein